MSKQQNDVFAQILSAAEALQGNGAALLAAQQAAALAESQRAYQLAGVIMTAQAQAASSDILRDLQQAQLLSQLMGAGLTEAAARQVIAASAKPVVVKTVEALPAPKAAEAPTCQQLTCKEATETAPAEQPTAAEPKPVEDASSESVPALPKLRKRLNETPHEFAVRKEQAARTYAEELLAKLQARGASLPAGANGQH